MQVRLIEIGPEGQALEVPLSLQWLTEVLSGKFLAAYVPVAGTVAPVRVRRVGLDVLLDAAFEVRVEAECSRCLKRFELPVQVRCALSMRPKPAAVTSLPEDQELTSEDVNEIFYEGDFIELDEILREQIILAMPMVPCCSEDCLGLCPQCGADRNRKACGCRPADDDSRLAVLRDLKVD